MTIGELLTESPEGFGQGEDGINMPLEFDSQPQDQIPRIRGTPEGRFTGRIGFLAVDFETGTLYIKTTPVELSTGWIVIASSSGGGGGGSMSGAFEDPNGNVIPENPNSGATYYQQGGTGELWHWQIIPQIWT